MTPARWIARRRRRDAEARAARAARLPVPGVPTITQVQ